MLICTLFGLLFFATGCYDNERIKFLEDDMTVDASAQTVMLHTNMSTDEIHAYGKYENGGEISYNYHNDTIRNFMYTITYNLRRRDTIKVELNENFDNRKREINIFIKALNSHHLPTSDSITITQLGSVSSSVY